MFGGFVGTAPSPAAVRSYAAKVCPGGYDTLSEEAGPFIEGKHFLLRVRCRNPDDNFRDSPYTNLPVYSTLSDEKPSVRWDGRLSTYADITCDGIPDEIQVGEDKDAVWIGIQVLPGRPLALGEKNKVVTRSFPRGQSDGAFCGPPRKVEVYDRSCEGEDGKPMAGCHPEKSCKAFTVSDDACDGFNFFWDDDHGTISWWRR